MWLVPNRSENNGDNGRFYKPTGFRPHQSCHPLMGVKAHTYWAIDDHADHIFDRSPVGMADWNVQV